MCSFISPCLCFGRRGRCVFDGWAVRLVNCPTYHTTVSIDIVEYCRELQRMYEIGIGKHNSLVYALVDGHGVGSSFRSLRSALANLRRSTDAARIGTFTIEQWSQPSKRYEGELRLGWQRAPGWVARQQVWKMR